jgi:cytochrome c551
VIRAAALAAALLAAAGCGSAGRDQLDGKTLFDRTCSSCHGTGTVGPDLAGTQLTKAEILDVIVHGKGVMPGGLLTGGDAERVAAYLR